MTGWRIGWLTHPKSVEPAAAAMAQCNNTGSTHFLQYGALAALSPQGDAFRGELLERCRHGRDVVADWIKGQNRMRWFRPEGAFYGFLHVDGLTDSLGFAQRMVTEDKVGIAPGWAFSLGDPRDDSYLRLCFAQDAASWNRRWAGWKARSANSRRLPPTPRPATPPRGCAGWR